MTASYIPVDTRFRYIAVWNANFGWSVTAYPNNWIDVGNILTAQGNSISGPYATRQEAEAAAQASLNAQQEIVTVDPWP